MDSAKSGPDGRFRIRYTPFGAEDALYFVSSRYQGIAYFSPPLRADTVRGGDADVMVYDTTTDTVMLRTTGRHFVVSSPRGATREVAEVFEIENTGIKTVIPRDSATPLWSTHLPPDATGASVVPGDVAAGAVVFRRERAELYAPLSPGVRQLVVTYHLPPKAFPLALPLERAVSVFEVLVEEPHAQVDGARLAPVRSASIGGRLFKRYLGQDVPAAAVFRVQAPPPIARNQSVLRALAIAIAAAMVGAFALWYVRRRRASARSVPHQVSDSERLIHELAALDARFERDGAGAGRTAEARAANARERAELKERITRALAAENSQG